MTADDWTVPWYFSLCTMVLANFKNATFENIDKANSEMTS